MAPRRIPWFDANVLKAIVCEAYGSLDRLELRDVEKPALEPDRLVVRVRAASLNPLDWRMIRGSPYIVRLSEGLRAPKRRIPGVDLAGVVEAVGENVTRFRVGDEVFGTRAGSLAEYVRGGENNFAHKPSQLTFEESAAIPVAACTALQALRDKGCVQPGHSVAVNGAAGGVGTFAVQIAKALGADITGVCSARNVDMVRSLGADHVVDYTADDFTRGRRYDVIVDAVGNRSFLALRRALAPSGSLVIVGGGGGRILGPLSGALAAVALGKLSSRRVQFFIATVTRADLEALVALIEDAKVSPVIDRTYPLPEAAAALKYLEQGHARGKVVVTIGDSGASS